MLTAQVVVLSVIESITKFVGASSFDMEFPSSSFVEFLHPVNAHDRTNAARIATILRFFFIKSSNDFIFDFLGEVECNKTSPKGLFQVLWVVYTTQIFREKFVG